MNNPSSKAKIILSIVFIYCLVCHFQFATAQNIGINTSGATPNASSILDLNTGNTFTSPNGKGFLPPNVALTGRTDVVTVSSPPTSLLVYNTATANTGTLSVTPGYYYWNGTLWVAFSSFGSNNWALLGNAGTIAGTNFLGTTDNQDLVFKRGNVFSGLISLNNTALGYSALLSNTSGIDNTAFGRDALLVNTTGIENTAIGVGALSNNTIGKFNTSLGVGALNANINGDRNVATGWSTLSKTTSGYNTASGGYALYNNTTGSKNTAIGDYAGVNNIGGNNNTFIGADADAIAAGFNNATAIGTWAKVGQSNALILGGTGAYAVNVGIGTSTPFLAKLYINSTAGNALYVSSPNDGLAMLTKGYNTGLLGDPTTAGWALRANDNTTPFSLNQSNALSLEFWNGVLNTTPISFLANGNVGIGSITPATKLSINTGTIGTGFQLQDGSQGANKVLTSDATGKASWQTPSSLLPTIYEFTDNFTVTNPGAASITTTVGPVFNWVAPASGRVLITFNKIAPYVFSGTTGNLGFGFTVNGSGGNMSFITAVYRFAGGDVVFAPATQAFNVTAGTTYTIQAYYFTQSMTSCMFNYRGNSSGSERFLIQYIN